MSLDALIGICTVLLIAWIGKNTFASMLGRKKTSDQAAKSDDP